MSDRELDRYKLTNDDIVVARIGATTGKSYLVANPPDAVFASYLIRIRTKSEIEPGYLALFMNSDDYWAQINASKGGRLKLGVNIPVLTNLQLPLPPKDEQKAIVTMTDALDRKIAAETAGRLASSRLFEALLNDLMSGRRRVRRLGSA
jgi:type I restriction enzyme S subunit